MHSLPDASVLAANFGLSGRTWETADFNRDGAVNLADFNLLAANFGLSAAGPTVTPQDWSELATVVPEPSSVALGLGILHSLTSRRRNGPNGNGTHLRPIDRR